MRPTAHLFTSGLAGGAFYLFSHSIAASIVCFLSGILIDLDHLFDFYFYHKRLTLSFKELYSECLEFKLEKFFLFLHSIELILLLWFLITIFKLKLIWVAFASGLTLHIILDVVGNNAFSFSYFFVYRLQKGFKPKLLFKNA